jgi:hypothetical protein
MAEDFLITATFPRWILLLALSVLGAGCADVTGPAAQLSTTGSEPAIVARPTPALEGLACVQTKHGCIPLNPDVTERTIKQTICAPGYTRSVRPSTNYTNSVKEKLLRETGLDESLMSEYELDHIVPLELGGHPRELRNLTLQPWGGAHGALRKDSLEHRLHSLVCRGELPLNEAQTCIADDWEACAAEYMAR